MKTQIFHEMKYDLIGHSRPYKTTFMHSNSSTFVYEPNLMKIFKNDNMETIFFNKLYMTWNGLGNISYNWNYMSRNYMKCYWAPKMSLLCHEEVLWFFTLRPFDLITKSTYVLLDNFSPCFIYRLQNFVSSISNKKNLQ